MEHKKLEKTDLVFRCPLVTTKVKYKHSSLSTISNSWVFSCISTTSLATTVYVGHNLTKHKTGTSSTKYNQLFQRKGVRISKTVAAKIIWNAIFLAIFQGAHIFIMTFYESNPFKLPSGLRYSGDYVMTDYLFCFWLKIQ